MKFVAAFPHDYARMIYYFFHLLCVRFPREPAVFSIDGFGRIDKSGRPDIHQSHTIANDCESRIVISVPQEMKSRDVAVHSLGHCRLRDDFFRSRANMT